LNADGEFDNLSFEILRDTPFIIQEDPVGEHNMEQIAIQLQQKNQPLKVSFKTCILKSKAAWQLMQSQRSKSAALLKRDLRKVLSKMK